MNLEQLRNLLQSYRDATASQALQQELKIANQYRQLEQQLASTQQQNAAYLQQNTFQASLLNQVCNAIIATDSDGAILYWNHYAETMYQWSAAEVLGKNIIAVLAPTDGQPIARQASCQSFKADLWQGELLLHRKDGSELWAEVKHTVLKNNHGEPVGFVGVSFEVAERKQSQTVLEPPIELYQSQAEIRDRRSTEIALRQSEDALARRERFLTTLVNIQTWLLTHFNESQICKKVLDPLGRVSGADRVYLFENQRDAASNLFMSQRYEWCADHVLPQIDNPLLQNLAYDVFCPQWKQILEQGAIINCTYTDFPAIERSILEPQGILSILLLPLAVGGEFWGFVGFDNCHEARLWDGLEVNLLEAAASSLSMMLERRLTEQRLQNQARRDQLLGAIALRIRESLDLEEILHRTVGEIRQFLQTDRVLIYRFDGQHGILVASSVLAEWGVDSGTALHQIWYRDANAQYERGQTYVVNDVENQGLPPEYLEFMRQLQVQAKLVVPIIQNTPFPTWDSRNPNSETGSRTEPLDELKGRRYLWGVLVVHQCSTVRQWQPFEVDLVQQLAVQVAIAIQQAQLFTQLQQQAQREHLLNQLSQALNSSLDAEHILQEIVDRTGEVFGVDRAVIFLLDEEVRALNEWRVREDVPSMLAFQCPIAEWPDLLDPDSEFNQGRAYYSLDLSLDVASPAHQIEVEEMQCRSVLSVPIVIRDRAFGALSIFTTQYYRTFTTEEVQFLHRIAGNAAIALYNAQNYSYLEQLVKQRTQELEQEKLISETANRAKSEFLATMSHELRTPLNAILGLSQILQREIFGDLTPKQLEYINHIHSSGEHLLMLINDILDLAKVESGREIISTTALSVPELCNDCLALIRNQAQEQNLQLISQLDPAIQFCFADERRLKQMLLNLLSNAVKFTPSGSVSLIVRNHLDGIVFIVKDTGIGIPVDKIPLLFQPFSQLDSQLSRRYAGTGLGLALTRKLARLHGGDVTVESIPEQGSTFTLYLPNSASERLDAPKVKILPQRSALGLTRHKGRILIVEDDIVSALLLQDYLKANGYQVLHQSNGDNFLQVVQDYHPNLVLLDVQLSGTVTGMELLHELRIHSAFQALPVVIVTAMAMAGDREKLLASGATAYLSKPLNIVQLESVLINYLEA